MAKPRTPNQKKRYAALNKRLAKYVSLVQSIYDSLALDASNIVTTLTDYSPDTEQPFRFKDYPLTKSRVDDLMRYFSRDLQALIYSGTTEEWKQSNLVQDLLANDVLKVYGMRRDGEKVKRYYQPNNDALRAFQQRKDKGFTVSQKVWNQSYNFKRELEYAISSGIERGQSAVTLSKRISKYLHDFPSLQEDYGERYGHAVDCQNCEYRSIRLARSEINMAYRTAEQTRWQQMNFIKGYEIKLSGAHPRHDVCDDLAGIYPKWFHWTGWHPNCYSDDSEVLTSRGWKLFKDVCKGDLILSLNPDTRNIEWVGIVATQCHKHHGEMMHFFNKSLDCLVTPEHQMVYLNKGDGRIKKCLASEYRKGLGGFYRGCNYDAPDIESIDINGKLFDFDTFCEFMAYYLSDGSTQHNSGICIAQKDGQPHKPAIIDCIRRLGYEPSDYGEAIYFFDAKFNRYLKQFGTAHDKFVPDEIKRASKRQIQIFLDAYTKCDGYTRLSDKQFIGNRGNAFVQKKEERLYFSVSDKMVRDLSELILKVGHRPSFRKGKVSTAHTLDGRTIKANYPCWTISECYSTTATVFEKETIPYDGYVYDLTLERNHIMYIRRNGKCFWGSNCMCYVVPIVMTDDEWYSGKGQEIEDMPQNYKDWVQNNTDRIDAAAERGTLPYFLKDNPEYKKYLDYAQFIEPTTPFQTKNYSGGGGNSTPVFYDDTYYQTSKVNNYSDIETYFGIKRGRPMSVNVADRENSNPNWRTEEGRSTNCIATSSAYVLRRQGFNVEAAPCLKGSLVDSFYSGDNLWYKVWQNIDGTEPTFDSIVEYSIRQEKKISKELYKEFYEAKTQEPGIYIVSVGWRNGGGHFTVLERFRNGTLLRVEPQTGDFACDLDELCRKGATRGVHFTRGVMRVDDKLFNPEYFGLLIKKGR